MLLALRNVVFFKIVFPEDRRDFSSEVVTMTFPADEFGQQMNDVPAPVPIINDAINEAQEELFVISLGLENAINPAGTEITRSVSLCRISDNDGQYRALYTHLWL